MDSLSGGHTRTFPYIECAFSTQVRPEFTEKKLRYFCQEELCDPGRNVSINSNKNSILTSASSCQ